MTAAVLTKGIDPLKKKKRIYEVDLLRGIPIFLVVLYHFCYDITQLPSLISNYQSIINNYPALDSFVSLCQEIMSNSFLHNILVPFFAGMFLFTCGISSSLSRNNLRRGLLLCGAALLISLGSYLISDILHYNVFIGFGILHIMGLSILIYALIELFYKKVLKKEVPVLLCFVIGFLVFFIGLFLRNGYLTDSLSTVTWPVSSVSGISYLDWINKDPLSPLYVALGYYSASIDYWPIFPYLGLIFLGIAVGKILYQNKKESYLQFLRFPVFKPILFIGGHTLWVYFLHQPIIIIILGVILLSMGFRL